MVSINRLAVSIHMVLQKNPGKECDHLAANEVTINLLEQEIPPEDDDDLHLKRICGLTVHLNPLVPSGFMWMMSKTRKVFGVIEVARGFTAFLSDPDELPPVD